ncbi:MAG: hypothetical protein C0618_04065 [Desulfuromonas sp.]|nr:MAG: hypothetical protein C0618_04065 [Desulfuromonas sp.]
MINIRLQDDERDVLAVILDKSLSGLSDEIAHTDARDYKDFLKERKDTLVKIRKLLHYEG